MQLLTIQGTTMERHPWAKKLIGVGILHWKPGYDEYKLTTPLDLLKRRLTRYYVSSNESNWPGGQVPTFARQKAAERAAKALATWGYCSTKVARRSRGKGTGLAVVATFDKP